MDKYLAFLSRRSHEKAKTFVGIHIRRKNYESFLKRYKSQLVTYEWYFRAMRIIEDELLLRSHEVIYVIGTDDIRWAKKHILSRKGQRNVFMASSGGKRSKY